MRYRRVLGCQPCTRVNQVSNYRREDRRKSVGEYVVPEVVENRNALFVPVPRRGAVRGGSVLHLQNAAGIKKMSNR